MNSYLHSTAITMALYSLFVMGGGYAAELATHSAPLSLQQAILLAQQHDPWLQANQHTQAALESQSSAAGSLPDPRVSVGLANLPTDSFDFNQEGMTQLKVGVSQMLPRGNSLELKQRQLQLLSRQYPYQRQDRQAKVAVIAGQLWFDIYRAQLSIALIEKNRMLFEQLADVAEAGYSSALERVRQQDIVRAQLELTRLEDRLAQLHQQQEVYWERLAQWLTDDFLAPIAQAQTEFRQPRASMPRLSRHPDIELHHAELYQDAPTQTLIAAFSGHPGIKALDKKIEADSSGIELAKQSYQPQWGINASYGYRDDDPMGRSRADFLSVGVSFDLPIFTANRQDQQVQSAIYSAEAVKTQKRLQLRKMLSAFEAGKAKLLRLNQRQQLYLQQLLPQMHQQAEASLSAYTSDDGNFAEVVRARIAQLNAEIELLGIKVEKQKTIMELNYFFAAATDKTATASGEAQ